MPALYIAADHAGFQLKQTLLQKLEGGSYSFEDLGASSEDSVDYPDYAKILVEKMERAEDAYGILICGSGIGMCIAANRSKRIRAALCSSPEQARLARAHNDANVLCLGSRFIDSSVALECVRAFLNTPFEGGRHSRRVEKLGLFRNARLGEDL